MNSNLLIWLADDLNAPWFWYMSETECGEVVTEVEKSRLKALDFKALNVVVSGQSVRVYDHELPSLRASERLKAANIYMEDRLAGASRDHHIVLGDDKVADQNTRLAVISKAKIQAIVETLKRFDLSAQTLIADFQAFKGEGSLATSEDVQIGPILLPDRLIQTAPEGYTIDRDWVNSTHLSTAINQEVWHVPERDIYKVLAKVRPEFAINLAQGAYARAQSFWPDFSIFKRASLFLVLLGLSWLTWQVTQGRARYLQAEAVRAETFDLYFNTTGKRVENPARDITRALKTRPKNQGDFLSLSALLFEVAARLDGVELDRLNYESTNNTLSLRLYYPSFETVSQLEKAVADKGGLFQSGGVREQAGRMVGEATLRLVSGNSETRARVKFETLGANR